MISFEKINYELHEAPRCFYGPVRHCFAYLLIVSRRLEARLSDFVTVQTLYEFGRLTAERNPLERL